MILAEGREYSCHDRVMLKEETIHTAFVLLGICKGFLLHEREFVEDLIPGSSIKHATEQGGIPHNDLFTRNSTILTIFRMRPPYGEIDFDEGLST